MEVGIRELKTKLSHYVARATRGETITVTDRGRPVAVLGPPLRGVDLAEAAAAGWVTPARARGLGPARRHATTRSVLAALTEDRAE